jgi:Flp pilus assembly protein TadG
MVEFAIVLPIFMLVLAGICDFGFMLYNRMTVINSAREGARAAAMVSDPTTILTTAQGAAIAAAAQGGITLTPGDVIVTCYQGSTPLSNCNAATVDDSVSVQTTYTYKTFFPLAFGATFPLGSKVQMVLDSIETAGP